MGPKCKEFLVINLYLFFFYTKQTTFQFYWLPLCFHSRGNRFIRIEKCRLDQKRKRKSEFLSDPEKEKGCLSVYVGNLSWKVTEKDIRDCFNTSNISSVRFACDKVTGKSRGFCHVDFEDDESLEKAIQKNQTELQGRPMKIAYAVSNRN